MQYSKWILVINCIHTRVKFENSMLKNPDPITLIAYYITPKDLFDGPTKPFKLCISFRVVP